ncbi:MAG: cell division protein FtsZ [Bacteroidales bacterium]|nr:cell division protein FtsZ [Bacteroidales bacterium]
MEDNINTPLFQFDSPKEQQSSYIKVIGVGGGGGNAVNHMYRQGIKGVDFIVCNTDAKALNASPVPNKIALGRGLGAGNRPEVAKKYAEEKADEILEAISDNTKMLFITAGMGGGTGTGAAPVIAKLAKSIELNDEEIKKILVVAIVTTPFSFEGKRRNAQALAGIEELRNYVDSMLVISDDKLRAFGDMVLDDAFAKADDVLLTAAKGIAEIITVDAYVNIDFQDVNTVMEKSNTALMGTGSGRGENRALDAIKAASTSVLLDDNDISGAKNVLLYITFSPDHKITMDELSTITDYMNDLTGDDTDMIWGEGPNDNLDDEINITLIATGFEKRQPMVVELPADKKVEKPVETKTETITEPTIIPHVEPKNEEKPLFEAKVETVDEKPSTGHRYTLDDETEKEVKVVLASDQARNDGDIYLKTREVEDTDVAVMEPVKPVVETRKPDPMPEMYQDDLRAKSRAERIAQMHALLRENPNGAQIAASMRPDECVEIDVSYGQHSSPSFSSQSTVGADGQVSKPNNYLYNNPD